MSSSTTPLQWTGTISTGLGFSESQATWPWKVPGMGQLIPLWPTCFSVLLPTQWRLSWSWSSLALPSLYFIGPWGPFSSCIQGGSCRNGAPKPYLDSLQELQSHQVPTCLQHKSSWRTKAINMTKREKMSTKAKNQGPNSSFPTVMRN